MFEDEQSPFASTAHRLNSLFRPIQKTQNKESDWTAFIVTPFCDGFILEPMYALEASIHLLNAVASFARALYLWTLNQQKSPQLVDQASRVEFEESWKHLTLAISAIVAQSFNTVLSALAWITRPIASLIHAADGCVDAQQENYEGGQQRPPVYQPQMFQQPRQPMCYPQQQEQQQFQSYGMYPQFGGQHQ